MTVAIDVVGRISNSRKCQITWPACGTSCEGHLPVACEQKACASWCWFILCRPELPELTHSACAMRVDASSRWLTG